MSIDELFPVGFEMVVPGNITLPDGWEVEKEFVVLAGDDLVPGASESVFWIVRRIK